MRIPLSYNLRNLVVRKTTTVMTALGIALTVSVLISVLALVSGLRHAFDTSAHPLNVLVVRNGAQSELASNFSRTQFQDLKYNSAIARSSTGEPLASLEMVTVIVVDMPGKESGTNINLRGVLPAAAELREGLQLEQGRWFRPGRRECVIGKAVAGKNPGMRIGGTLHFGRGSWEIVGIMRHGKSAVNSEVWVDVNQVSADYNRTAVVSSALLRAVDEAAVKTLIDSLEADRRLNVDAMSEKEYYDRQTVAALPVQFIGTLVAFIMAIGSCFAAMNTMYAAVARRAREIGTLRVLGFPRSGVLTSFFLESLLLSVIGGLLGVLLVLPMNGMTSAVGSFVTFSEVAFEFRITPMIALGGLMFGLIMGALGGIFPAASAARKEILTALRES